MKKQERNSKRCIIIVIIVSSMLVMTLILNLIAYLLSDNILANKMIKKYSDDLNYISLYGVIMGINGNNVTIQCEMSTYIEYGIEYDGECADFCIYSNQVLNLDLGDNIDFMTLPFYFYNGQRLPIVEVKKSGETLLAFEEGKENLIEWTNKTFS